MIDTQAIRNRILQLALQGQLVEQISTDTPASELVLKLSEEINGSASCSPVKDEEIPYSVPLTWVWCRLSDIGTTNIGLTYHPEDTSATGTIVARSSNIVNGKMDYSDLVRVTCSIRDNQYLGTNDILICARNGSKALVGKCAIFEGEPNTVAFGAFMAVFRTPLYRYVYYYFNTTVFKRNFSGDDSKQINQVTQKILKESLIPIPPLEEQQRIVDKIDQAFSVLDTIDALQAQYANNLSILKNKLIEAAIQGKLTDQLSEDGTAEELYKEIQAEKQALIDAGKIKKEKQLPEIKVGEVPFEIPASWKWVRLASICYGIFAGGDKPEDFSKTQDDAHPIPVVANGVSNEGIMGYTATATAPSNTLTVAGRGTIGFPCYRDYEYCPVVRLIVIMQSINIDPKYLYYVFLGMPADSVGSSIPQLTVPMVNPKLIPLPPLAEQKRIVERLDDILPMCER